LEEVKSDYRRIIYGESLEQAKKAYRDFVSKWKKLAPKVVASLEEAGEELLTFTAFPKASGNRFVPPMRSSGSMGSFAAG
jgi:transposase-like protein